ncbi:MAG TPA: carbamoyltransferase HypF, partial [Candidatus Glassbacteria bacterium]|nr:carbamoyltransferase HypF [Candidatus Glassbacteria bacterium]
MKLRIKITVTGIVQGVGFRPFIYRTAKKHQLFGFVRNRGDAGVEIFLEGNEKDVTSFQSDLKTNPPPLAQIYEIIAILIEGKNQYSDFTIYESSQQNNLSGSIIPPDISICNECLTELRDPKNPRYEYFFITCTNCGPRFTIIKTLPYDRINTTMNKFPLVGKCKEEYTDPKNRRFHAQTVACPNCGPKVYLTSVNGKEICHKNPIQEAGKLLSEGSIIAIKGYGGFHIASSSIKPKPLEKLRTVKHRRSKPFAVMARNLEAAKTIVEVNPIEIKLLTSFSRPIVLLNKKSNFPLSSLVAPDLHNLGVMLPYTALHYMLFDKVSDQTFIMTSANPPNQPIIKDNDVALKRLNGIVDYFLFHDREIAYRCDDSVLRVHGDYPVFLRRSRGYSPKPIILNEKSIRSIVGLGGELNNTSCILNDNKAFISQHIGDIENTETRAFLEKATSHLIRLTNSKIETIACDLHPKFATTLLAKKLAAKNDWELIQVQHHHAHIAALMLEHSLNEIVGIVCDGYGYGTDGEAWGGEILFSTRESENFERLGHLEKQPLLGGDLATRFPIRIAAGILHKKIDITDWLSENSNYLPHAKTEVELILNQLSKKTNIIKSTSCGRILDAVAAILGICFERSYEGEPAVKLESLAFGGRDVLNQKPAIKDNILLTTPLLLSIFNHRKQYSQKDLAYSAHTYVAEGLAELAIEKALEKGIKNIGFSGGVASNKIISDIIRKKVESEDLNFIVHKQVPPGDGGLSFGQAIV